MKAGAELPGKRVRGGVGGQKRGRLMCVWGGGAEEDIWCGGGGG